MYTVTLNYGNYSEAFDQTTTRSAKEWWEGWCSQNEPIYGDFTIEISDDDGNIIDEHDVEDLSPVDSQGQKLKVGDYIMDHDGIYEIHEIFENRIYVCEVTFDEWGNPTTISGEYPMLKSDVEKCEKY